MQAVSPAPNYAYWADETLSDQIITASNEHIAEICATNPDRFVGICHVSLQHPELAARQLVTAMTKLGMRGVEIGTRVTAGQTILIIEAMKTMNHIPAPYAGTVLAVLVDDGQPVEYAEPLAVIEKG